MRSIHLFVFIFHFYFLLLTLHLVSVFAGALCFPSSTSQTASVARFFLSLSLSSFHLRYLQRGYDTHLYARWELLVPKVVIAGDINRLHSLAGIGILRLIPIVSWFADLI